MEFKFWSFSSGVSVLEFKFCNIQDLMLNCFDSKPKQQKLSLFWGWRQLVRYLAIFLSVLPVNSAWGAELVGRAILAADTFAPGPTSGQFKKTKRKVPFLHAQPVQGFSAVIPGPKKGTYLVLSDNGFGGKSNSPDYVLRIYAVEPNFATGKVFPVDLQTGARLKFFNRQSFLELKDKQNLIQFPIVADRSTYPGSNSIPVSPAIEKNRLLTGGDFDIESFRKVNDGTYWLGDEFGPFLLHVGTNGELLDIPIPLPNLSGTGKLNFVKSPDHPDFADLSREEATDRANLGGSSGFEGLALNASGNKLYAMLEGPLKEDANPRRLLIHEFDLATKKYTGEVFPYKLEDSGHAIGELTAINDQEFIVIERDRNQGDPNNRAFKQPAKFKRLYKIDIQSKDAQGFVKKELLVDLLKIADPQGIGGRATTNGIFTFPFVTIESVLPINATNLLIVNDNNYADSIGRIPNQVDNTEFILIRLDKPID